MQGMNLPDILASRNNALLHLKSEKPYSLEWKELYDSVDFVRDLLIEISRVGILYDVDTDGAVSGKIIEENMIRHGVMTYHMMNKQKKHGLNDTVIDWVVENNIELLFVVDGGTNDIEYHQKLSDLGVSVVVLDHHEITEVKAIKNVHVVNCSAYETLPKLSGAGVCYRFVEALDRELKGHGVTNYEGWVGLTVLSDHCSMLDSENRYYVDKLYAQYNKIDLFSAFTFWGSKKNLFLFGVIPFINACIRLNKVDLVIDLMLCNNTTIIKKLVSQNQKEVIAEQKLRIEKALERCIYNEGNSIILIKLHNDDVIYSGLTGLMANKIMGEYGKSTLVLYNDGDYLRGSFRGRDSINSTLLTDIGWTIKGHPQAAGVELLKSEGSRAFNEILKIESSEVARRYDFELNDTDIVRGLDFLTEVARFNEYASGDIEPLRFKLNVSKKYFKEMRGKLRLYNFISFEVKDFNSSRKVGEDWIIEPSLDREGVSLMRF